MTDEVKTDTTTQQAVNYAIPTAATLARTEQAGGYYDHTDVKASLGFASKTGAVGATIGALATGFAITAAAIAAVATGYVKITPSQPADHTSVLQDNVGKIIEYQTDGKDQKSCAIADIQVREAIDKAFSGAKGAISNTQAKSADANLTVRLTRPNPSTYCQAPGTDINPIPQ